VWTLDLVLPSTCASCGAVGAVLCDRCRAQLRRADGRRCPRCWLRSEGICRACLAAPPALRQLRSAFIYEGVARQLVLTLKYWGVPRAAEALAAEAGGRLVRADVDLIAPIPMTAGRRRARTTPQQNLVLRWIANEHVYAVWKALGRLGLGAVVGGTIPYRAEALVQRDDNRANALVRLDRSEDAAADYERAIELAPDDPDIYVNRGLLRLFGRDFDSAEQDFRHALNLRPDDGAAHTNLGLTLLYEERPQEALDSFTTAVALEPGQPGAHYGMASAAAALGQSDAAVSALQQATSLNPRYAEAARTDDHFESLRTNPRFQALVGDGQNAG